MEQTNGSQFVCVLLVHHVTLPEPLVKRGSLDPRQPLRVTDWLFRFVHKLTAHVCCGMHICVDYLHS